MSGMHAGLQAEPLADALQEVEELLALLVAELRAQVALVADSQRKRTLERALALVCEVQRPRAPVLRPQPAFEQAALLERVEKGNHPAGQNSHSLAQRLLREAFSRSHRAQEREIARLEIQRGEDLTEAS